MATLASNELNETEKKLLVITRQGKSILLILLLYIFIQNITNVHTYIHIYELFTRFVSVLRITAVTFVQMHCTTFPAYPSRCITQSWRNGRLYFTFTSPLLHLYLAFTSVISWLQVKKNNKLLKKPLLLLLFISFCGFWITWFTKYKTMYSEIPCQPSVNCL